MGVIGHDLRQSLQIVQGTYSMLRRHLTATPQSAWVARGENAVQTLTEQLNFYTDAFLLADRHDKIRLSRVALAPLLERAVGEVSEAAAFKGVQVRALAPRHCVWSEPILLGCILRNLMVNAVKYTDPGGRVLLACRRKGAEIEISVYDTGAGIPQELLPRIFDEFTRRDAAGRDGMGIGLSIVRRALELLRHRIEVRSKEGKGSVFTVWARAAGSKQLDGLSTGAAS